MFVFITYAPPAPPPPTVDVPLPLLLPPVFVTLPPAPPPPQHSTVTFVTPTGQIQAVEVVKDSVVAQLVMPVRTSSMTTIVIISHFENSGLKQV
jgi:hypothetical protein